MAPPRINRRERASPIATTEPSWWPDWMAKADARLHSQPVLVDIPTDDGTRANYILRHLPEWGADTLYHARGLVGSLVTIQTDKKPVIAFSSRTNFSDLQSRSISLDGEIVASCPFRPSATRAERVDIIAGVALHEAMHIECSSAELCVKARGLGQLFSQIHNIVEDESLEMRLALSSPGYVPYIDAAKRYMFGDAHPAMVKGDRSLLNAFLLFVRWPTGLDASVLASCSSELDKIRKILTPFPADSAEVFLAAVKIHKLLLLENAGEHGSPPSTVGLRGFLEQADSHGPADHLRAPVSIAQARERSSTAPVELGRRLTWADPPEDKAQYESDLAAVMPYANRLRRWLRAWDEPAATPLRLRSRGRLDPRRLHRVPTGDERLFEQRIVPAHRRVAVAVLVDESGSMKGDKIVAARRTAILVREALHSLENVELFIYGHTADKPDRTTNMFRYWRPGWRRKHSLGSVASRSNNRDGAAILAAGQDVKRSTGCRDIVLLVISDGQPQATGYKGLPAVSHTRSVVQRLQKQMTVIQVAIDPVVASSRMFNNHVRFTELDRVPDQVGKLIRKLVA